MDTDIKTFCTFPKILVLLSMLIGQTLSDYGTIAQTITNIYEDTVITATDATTYLDHLNALLVADINSKDIYLPHSLIEISHAMEFIVNHFETHPQSNADVKEVTIGILKLSSSKLVGINQTVCVTPSLECTFTVLKAIPLIRVTDEYILRMLSLIVDSGDSEAIELSHSNITAICNKAKLKNLTKRERVCRLLSIPNVPKNELDISEENVVVKIFVIQIFEDVYSFIPGPVSSFNGGVVKTFLRNMEGQYLDVFEEIDVFIDATGPINNAQYTFLANSSGADELAIRVNTESRIDSGILRLHLASLQTCTTNAFGEDTRFNITTTGLSTTISDNSPSHIKVNFENQTLTFVLTPPMESFSFNTYCEACVKKADIAFLLDSSGSVGAENFFLSKLFVTSVVEGLEIGVNKVRVSVLRFASETNVVFHLTQFHVKQSIIDEVKIMKNTTGGSTNTAGALYDVRTKIFPPYERGVQKLLFVMTDGASNNRAATLKEADVLRAQGIQIIAVGVGPGVSQIEIYGIADDPKKYRAFFVNDFADLDKLAVDIVSVVCRGTWSNFDTSTAEFGGVSTYTLNSSPFMWKRNVGMQLKSMEENTVVFSSNHFGTFGFDILAISPEALKFEQIFNNIDQKIADSPAVLAMIIGLLCALAIGTVGLRYLDKKDENMWLYKPLKDNPPNIQKYYFVSIHTGLWSSGKLSTTPFMILKGWYGETDVRALVDRKKTIGNLPRWKFANFAVGVSKDIGPLTELKIWHDGTNNSCRWYLDKVLIRDGESGQTYTFLCGDWLAADRGDGKTYRQLYPAHKEFKDGKILFSCITRFKLFDDYLWISLFVRPSFSRFTRVQRLYCCSAVLSLAMVVSAMWFRTEDGEKTYGITLGPVSINYKQVFVGIVTVAMSAPALMIMTFIFRNRHFRNEYGSNQRAKAYIVFKSKDAMIPWWTVFAGYGIALIGISSGCVFSFFYSLQWGNDISTNWIMSLVFGTTNSVVFLQPLSVVFACVVVAGIFKTTAKKNINEMAPPVIDESLLNTDDFGAIPTSKWPGGMETRALKKMRKQLVLDRQLYTHFRGLLLQVLFICLLAFICSHTNINQTYRQNESLIQLIKPQKQLNTMADIWSWLKNYYFKMIFPKERYNGEILLPPEREYMADSVSYRMGPVRLRQKRVKGHCHIPNIIKERIGICNPKLTPDTEDTANYCPGWAIYLGQCEKSGFAYTHANGTSAFTYFGTYGIYDGGGYVKDLDPFEVEIRMELEKLRANNWIDERTRFFVAENVVVNANNMLFSLVSMAFELSEVGGIEPKFRVQTSKLYPYINVWDYMILALQCVFMLVTFIRILMFIYDIWNLKFQVLLSLSSIGKLWSILLSAAAIGCYIARIDRTIYIINEIFNSVGQFMSFEIVQLLDDIYKGCLGTVLFIQILFLLKPLTFNYYLYMMKATITLSRNDLVSFGMFLLIPYAAFASIVYCFLGPYSYAFRNMFATLLTLMRTMLAMTKFRDTFGQSDVGNHAIFSIFVFTMSIILVNMFICILNDAFAFIKSNPDGGGKIAPFDKKLNAHFWWKVKHAFNIHSDNKNNDTDADEDKYTLDQRITQMDRKLNQLLKLFRR